MRLQSGSYGDQEVNKILCVLCAFVVIYIKMYVLNDANADAIKIS